MAFDVRPVEDKAHARKFFLHGLAQADSTIGHAYDLRLGRQPSVHCGTKELLGYFFVGREPCNKGLVNFIETTSEPHSYVTPFLVTTSAFMSPYLSPFASRTLAQSSRTNLAAIEFDQKSVYARPFGQWPFVVQPVLGQPRRNILLGLGGDAFDNPQNRRASDLPAAQTQGTSFCYVRLWLTWAKRLLACFSTPRVRS